MTVIGGNGIAVRQMHDRRAFVRRLVENLDWKLAPAEINRTPLDAASNFLNFLCSAQRLHGSINELIGTGQIGGHSFVCFHRFFGVLFSAIMGIPTGCGEPRWQE